MFMLTAFTIPKMITACLAYYVRRDLEYEEENSVIFDIDQADVHIDLSPCSPDRSSNGMRGNKMRLVGTGNN